MNEERTPRTANCFLRYEIKPTKFVSFIDQPLHRIAMPHFFRNLFNSSAKPIPAVPPAPPAITGHKVVRPKTVSEVLGPTFNLKTGFSAHSAFSKKLLKYAIKAHVAENLLFLFMCEKFVQTPSAALFDAIYEDFVKDTPRTHGFDSFDATNYQVNLPVEQVRLIEFVRKQWQLAVAMSSVAIPLNSTKTFALASKEIQKLLERDVFPRLIKEYFDTAFTLSEPGDKRQFDDAIAYLRAHQIMLP